MCLFQTRISTTSHLISRKTSSEICTSTSTYKPELEAGGDDLILECDEQFSSANKCFSVEVKNTQDKNNQKVVGHLV